MPDEEVDRLYREHLRSLIQGEHDCCTCAFCNGLGELFNHQDFEAIDLRDLATRV